MHSLPSLKTASLASKRVIVRADFDIPVSGGKAGDAFRLEANIPTIDFLLKRKAKIRIVTHLGRPHGAYARALSAAPVAEALSKRLKKKVALVADPFDEKERERFADSSDILMFENIRFWPGEEENRISFAKGIAAWGDAYINEAFANSHRAHASMVLLPGMLPHYAGIRLQEEVRQLGKLCASPRRPFAAILGGAKLETKLPLLRRLVRSADFILLGGGLANTVLALRGRGIGRSLADTGIREKKAVIGSKKIILPVDALVVRSLAEFSGARLAAIGDVQKDEYIVDIGPKTASLFSSILRGAETIVWNGPMGLAEKKESAKGTRKIASALAELSSLRIAGGGDTLAALARTSYLEKFSFVSTGGGAMLEFLAGKKLPGIEALKNQRLKIKTPVFR